MAGWEAVVAERGVIRTVEIPKDAILLRPCWRSSVGSCGASAAIGIHKCCFSTSAHNHAIDRKQNDRTGDRQREATNTPIIHTGTSPKRSSNESTDDRPGNAQQHGYDKPARISPRHQ